MMETAEQIARGYPSRRIRIKSKDELGELADSLTRAEAVQLQQLTLHDLANETKA
jgi:HAMP domain-containing protein